MPSKEVNIAAKKVEWLLPKVGATLFGGARDPLNALPTAQLKVLRQLNLGSKSPSQLARDLSLTPSAVSQLAAKLCAAGYVVETPDPIDRRMKQLSLTAETRQILKQRSSARAAKAAKTLELLDTESLADLIRCLESVAALAQSQQLFQPE